MSQRPVNTILVLAPGLVAFSMGQTVLFALAGPVFRDIGLSETQLGILVSAAAVVFVVSSGFWGRWSDRWGRKPTIVFGLVTYGIISLLFAYTLQLGLQGAFTAATAFTYLLILRLLYAALGAGIQPASVALMADVSSAADRSSAVAQVGAAFGIGMVLGPAAAAALVGFGVLTPLYAIAVLGLITAGVAAFALPGGAPVQAGVEETSGTGSLRLIHLGALLIGGFLVYTTLAALQQTLAFNVQDLLGTDSADAARLTGFCFMAIAIAMLAVQGGLIQWLKPNPVTLLFAGLPTIIIALLVYTLASSYVQLLLAAALLGVGFGLSTPGMQSAASVMAGQDEQGRIAGVMQAMMSMGFVVGPLVGTQLYALERTYASQFCIAVMALATVLTWTWAWRNRAKLRPIQQGGG
ncbi:MAG: MFS transporter [Pseudomonadota bacterium]